MRSMLRAERLHPFSVTQHGCSQIPQNRSWAPCLRPGALKGWGLVSPLTGGSPGRTPCLPLSAHSPKPWAMETKSQ